MPPQESATDFDLDAALERFGHNEFRLGQRSAIETLLTQGRVLYVAPTGGGKSLAYQLPASLLSGTTLVVSPLIALMHDQVASYLHLVAGQQPVLRIDGELERVKFNVLDLYFKSRGFFQLTSRLVISSTNWSVSL